jgi:hypothetical protein
MSGATSLASPSAPSQPAARLAGRRALAVLLITGYLVNVIWRLWLAREVPNPAIRVDEDSYLNTARVLAGGVGGRTTENDLFRRVGYSLLVSPAYWFPGTFAPFRVVQVINALVNSLTFPLAYLFARRLFRLDRRFALLAALAAATLPAAVFYTAFAMTDVTLTPLALGLALTLWGWAQAPSSARFAALAGLICGAFYFVHVRGTVVLAIVALLVAALAVQRRVPWRTAGIFASSAAVLVLVNHVLIHLIRPYLTVTGFSPSGPGMVKALFGPAGVRTVLGSLLGQFWYLTVITGGLAAIAMVWTLRRRFPPPTSAFMLVFLLITVGIAAGCAVVLSLSTETHAQQIKLIVYVRYIHFLAPLWFLAGVAALTARPQPSAATHSASPSRPRFGANRGLDRRLWVRFGPRGAEGRFGPWVALVAGALLVAGAILVAEMRHIRHLTAFQRNIHPFDAPEILAPQDATYGGYAFRPAVVTIVALLVMLALVVCLRRAPVWVMVTVIAVNLAGMMLITHRISAELARANYPQLHLAANGVARGDVIVMARGLPFNTGRTLEREVDWQVVTYFPEGAAPPAAAEVIFSGWNPEATSDKVNWNGPAYGFHRVAGDPQQRWIMWRRN